MAGSKRKKLKKILSPTSPPPPPEPTMNDEDLMEDLMAQLDSKDKTVQEESATVLNEMQLNQVADQIEKSKKQDSKSRHQARQARKAAALAEKLAPVDAAADARVQKEIEDEENAIQATCNDLGVAMFEINPDGHCLFSAVADQLSILGILPAISANYAVVRAAAADYIYTHPDDFLPFLPSIGGEDTLAATANTGLMGPAEFAHYCNTIKSTAAWGGEPEILALSRAYSVPIHVIQHGTPPIVVHNPLGGPNVGDLKAKNVVRISYHRRMYGLGEHYNSLRPKGGLASGIKAIFNP
ncbi:hypothetical protein NLI96_g4791 [Meripilus lineatus]|uniref:OTU domain-containing protein n=1 Tax=Meripilus lineatus TaxID=2056292 RepID=A0AAD5YHL6_9APHY|nr:hypothetical protein NLI96_g4791 [Physisporinus lineatus]